MTMNQSRKLNIAVLGSAAEPVRETQRSQAHVIGKTIALTGGILLTGGCPGVPYAAVQGAAEFQGTVIGISPAHDIHQHLDLYRYPVQSQIMVFTGMGRKGRNVILVRSADACIFVGGGMGTLNEFTIAVDEFGTDKVIGMLAGSGGFTDEFPRLLSMHQRTVLPKIVNDTNPENLVARIFSYLGELSKHE